MPSEMEAQEQIEKFKEFIETHYLAELTDNLRHDEKSLTINFSELSKFDVRLADLLLDQPEETIKCVELAIELLDLEGSKGTNFRVKNPPSSCDIQIQHLRSQHLSKLKQIEGVVFAISDIRPHITSARFECPSCGNIINVLQLDKQFKEPTRCGCGRKGKFHVMSKELTDAYSMVLEECPENTNTPTLQQLSLLIKGDLTKQELSDKIYQGLRIKIVGVLKELFIFTKSGSKSTQLDWFMEVIHIQPYSEDYTNIKITGRDIEEIKRFSEEYDVVKELSQRIYRGVYGYEKEKMGLLLSVFGGVKKEGRLKRIRGDIHILLIGDPSTAKSTIGEITAKISPKSRYFSCGKKTSEAGLTGACVRDELLKVWTIQAGALPMAHGGLCVADELDGLTKEQQKELNEGLERQKITITKTAKGELKSECSFIGIANPKHGKFDLYSTLSDEINLTPTLLSRFDLIFLFKISSDEKVDEGIADTMLNENELTDIEQKDIEFIRKYITYAKKIKPKLTEEAKEYIKKQYVTVKKNATNPIYHNIPITPRDLSSIVRLSEAYARANLKEKVGLEDAKFAFGIKMYSLVQTALDKETGTLDVGMIQIGETITETQIAKQTEIILQSKEGGIVAFEDLKREIEKKLNKEYIEEQLLDKVLSKLKEVGNVYEPRYGFWALIP